jgi:hypothetical protein
VQNLGGGAEAQKSVLCGGMKFLIDAHLPPSWRAVFKPKTEFYAEAWRNTNSRSKRISIFIAPRLYVKTSFPLNSRVQVQTSRTRKIPVSSTFVVR